MSENQTARKAPKSKSDRWVKISFLAVILIVGLVVWNWQRKPPELPGWGKDLPAALEQARAESRLLLVFFTNQTFGEAERFNVKTMSQPANRKAIDEQNFIRVAFPLDTDLESKYAREYNVRVLPTLMILSPEGKELNRREGKVGEVPFRDGFLDLSDIRKPDAGS